MVSTKYFPGIKIITHSVCLQLSLHSLPGCYGISESQSVASTESSASTEPWFCDACKAGVKPVCIQGCFVFLFNYFYFEVIFVAANFLVEPKKKEKIFGPILLSHISCNYVYHMISLFFYCIFSCYQAAIWLVQSVRKYLYKESRKYYQP